MKTIIKQIKQHYKLVLATLLIGSVIGYMLGNKTPAHQDKSIHQHDVESAGQVWTCSMHPQIRQDKTGKCPICAMDLIPLSSMQSDEEDVDPNEIAMSESAAKLADIETMIVAKGIPHKIVHLQGKVHSDERNVAELTARFGGRIEKLFINFTGQNVRKGEKLATIYSPKLVAAQQELLEAIAFKESRPSLYMAAKGKLKLWDLSDEQVAAIEEKGEPLIYFDVLSPISGTVSMRHVALGDYVKEGSILFKVVDLSKVWVLFDAYESDLPWIKLNDKVDFTIQALPGKNFSAKVSYIDPFIDAKTRVAKVRVVVPNPQLILKPEMFAAGLLESKIAEHTHKVLIPKSSILWTGKRAIVYVKIPHRKTPAFLYREIILGAASGNFYVVDSGLEVGEEIAINGVFKIDAAAQLAGKPSMMNPQGGTVSGAHQHNLKSKEKTEAKSYTVPAQFNKQLTALFTAYLQMKNAFVDSNKDAVSTAALEVQNKIEKTDMLLLKGEAHTLWMEHLKKLKPLLLNIITSKNIEAQRQAFALFNEILYASIKSFGLDKNTTVYYQYCPMAIEDKGAFWLSETEEIRNPYFGEAMLKCGETKEILKY